MKKFFPVFLIPGMLFAEGDEVAVLETPYTLQTPVMVQEGPSLDGYLRPRKNAFLAGALSGVVPGLGHAYLGDYRTAGMLLGGFGTSLGLGLAGVGEATVPVLITAQNVGFYSAYAAYRDARAYNNFVGYNYEMPRESALELVAAPFQWSVIRKPTVWGGLLGALTVGITLSSLFHDDDAGTDCSIHMASSGDALYPLMAFPVGIGEEAFFRGYLMPAITEGSSPLGGLILSSLLFGAVHIPNAFAMDPKSQIQYYTVSIPFLTAMGVYFGWVTQRSGSLKESVALHSWYDFTLFLASYSLASSAKIGKPTFAFSVAF